MWGHKRTSGFLCEADFTQPRVECAQAVGYFKYLLASGFIWGCQEQDLALPGEHHTWWSSRTFSASTCLQGSVLLEPVRNGLISCLTCILDFPLEAQKMKTPIKSWTGPSEHSKHKAWQTHKKKLYRVWVPGQEDLIVPLLLTFKAGLYAIPSLPQKQAEFFLSSFQRLLTLEETVCPAIWSLSHFHFSATSPLFLIYTLC